MKSLREILAANLRENRRRLAMSQPELAELADLSTHYISMIEVSRKFPTPEVLERLAAALGIASHELFSMPPSPEKAIEKLHYEVITSIKQEIRDAVKVAIAEQCKETHIKQYNNVKSSKKVTQIVTGISEQKLASK